MTWMQTYTGLVFDLTDPRTEQVCLADIAHSLAYQCRFSGHTRKFYSVAQHCVIAARHTMETMQDPTLAMHCLLHDSEEAYLGDMIRPLKAFAARDKMEWYRELEETVKRTIYESLFGVHLSPPTQGQIEYIHRIDLRLLAAEARSVMRWPPPKDWCLPYPPLASLSTMSLSDPWSPRRSEADFLECFRGLLCQPGQTAVATHPMAVE